MIFSKETNFQWKIIKTNTEKLTGKYERLPGKPSTSRIRHEWQGGLKDSNQKKDKNRLEKPRCKIVKDRNDRKIFTTERHKQEGEADKRVAGAALEYTRDWKVRHIETSQRGKPCRNANRK